MSFFYCIATLLEFAGVHYFTKVGSGEIPINDDEWDDCEEVEEDTFTITTEIVSENPLNSGHAITRRRSSIICPIYNVIFHKHYI